MSHEKTIDVLDAEQVEQDLVTRLKSEIGLVQRLDRSVVTAFAEAKLHMRAMVLATDPLGISLGARPEISTAAEEATTAYLEALANLRDAVEAL